VAKSAHNRPIIRFLLRDWAHWDVVTFRFVSRMDDDAVVAAHSSPVDDDERKRALGQPFASIVHWHAC